jgi:glycosyltransferase involved in cell wall biosynthesis
LSAPGILFLSHTAVLGGAERSLLDLAAGWEGDREVMLLADGPLRAALEARGVKVVTGEIGALARMRRDAGGPGLGALADITRLARDVAAAAKSKDIIHANSQKAFVVAAAAGLLARRPVAWHLRDILAPPHFSASNIRSVTLLANLRAAAVIANSGATAAAFQEAGGKAGITHVVHNGIDAAPFDAVTDADIAARRHALGGDGQFVIAACGRLAPWKGQHIAIEALSRLPGAVLWVAGAALFGEDEYAASLPERAERLGVADRVRFLGERSDIPTLMRAADVVVHTAVDAEPFGRVVVEGMLARKPVIASDAGGVREILRAGDEGTGWLVPPGDAAALAAAIEQVRGDAPRAHATGTRAYTDAVARFSVRTMSAGVRAVLENIVSARRARS